MTLPDHARTQIAEMLKRQSNVAVCESEPDVGSCELTETKNGNGAPASVERVAAQFTKAQLKRRQIATKEGNLRGCLANALDLLRFSPEFDGVLGYNEFSLRIFTKRATPWGKPRGENWTDRDDVLCLEWLERNGVFLNSSNKASEAARTVAQEHAFHPIKDYFRSLEWDKKPRLESLFTTYAGAPDTPLNRAAGRVFLIGAVARIESPGCQHDTVCLLIGPQGAGKSSFCREICPRPEFFTDHVSELGSKDSRLELAGKLILEFAELDRVKGRELGRVKAYLTSRTDCFRPPYGRSVVDIPRSCVFVGTSNDEVALADESGNRRFLPIHVGKIDIEKLSKDKAQLWAESFYRYQKGAKWYLDSRSLLEAAREQQDLCYASGQWDSDIEAFLENPQPRTVSDRPFHSIRGKVLLEEALVEGVGKPKEFWTQADFNSAARCLVHNGYHRRQLRIDGRRAWFYVKDES